LEQYPAGLTQPESGGTQSIGQYGAGDGNQSTREQNDKSRFVTLARLKGQEGLPAPSNIFLPVDRPCNSGECSNGPLGREPRERVVFEQSSVLTVPPRRDNR